MAGDVEAAMTAAIELHGLTKRYGRVEALTDLTLEVPNGSVFGFLGPNGAGKTTALKLLAGLTRATSGSAAINGVPVNVQGGHRSEFGYLAQDPRFYGWMSGRETLEYVARLHPARRAARSADDLLALVGLADAADRRTGTYSGGMRQRLGIAQALAGDARVLLLDEPAAALDPIGRRDVLELMERLRGETTIFYSTHILDDVQRVSDGVAILDRGRLVVSAPTADLLRRVSGASLSVILIGATQSTKAALAALSGVVDVAETARTGSESHYRVAVSDGATAAVQAAVMRTAASSGLVVASNQPEGIDLEAAFLRIVEQERAA
jgi:ABC-2 type transport system ATP-binding protein